VVAVCDYLKAEKWDELIILGDLLDGWSVSRWNEGTGRVTDPALAEEVAHTVGVLDKILGSARKKNPACKAVLLEGNHEHRINDYVDKHPELAGFLSVPQMLGLKKRRVRWVPSHSAGEVYRIADAVFIHGLWANKYHAHKHAEAFGGHVYYGHTHDIQEHSKPLMGDGNLVMAKSLGCLCGPQRWARGRPDRWQRAMSVFRFHNGTHQETTVKIHGGRFIGPTTGKLYGAQVKPRRKKATA